MINLLQAESHVRNMNTVDFEKGEGSCVLKHILYTKGEIEEAMSHCTEKEFEIFSRLNDEINTFLENVEKGVGYGKKQLIETIRTWRRDVEKTMPYYQTFNCKCTHFIPQFKIMLAFISGMFLFFLLSKI